jgi:integrase
MLQVRALTLPVGGWGRIRVTEADDGTGSAADPKTGERWVPISAELVVFLRSWIERHQLRPSDYLFRGPDGQVPARACGDPPCGGAARSPAGQRSAPTTSATPAQRRG